MASLHTYMHNKWVRLKTCMLLCANDLGNISTVLILISPVTVQTDDYFAMRPFVHTAYCMTFVDHPTIK